MTKSRLIGAVLFILTGWSGGAAADDTAVKAPNSPGQSWIVVTPESSIAKPGDAGERAHTNTRILMPTSRAPPGLHPGQDGSSDKPPESPSAGSGATK
jgi:hypothetical protein